jgi:hypothetical protein
MKIFSFQKWVTIGMFSVALSSIAIIACRDSEVNAPGEVNDPGTELRRSRQADIRARRERAASVGHFHNLALEFVKNDVRDYISNGTHSFADGMAYAEASCNRFMQSQGLNYTCVMPGDRSQFSAQVNLDPLTPERDPRSDLSQAALDYLASMQSAADAATSASAFISSAATISAAAEGELDGADLDAVLNAEAVGDSSFTYWETSGDSWVTTYANNNHLQEPYTIMVEPPSGMHISSTVVIGPAQLRYGWFHWKSVAAWDVAGCIAVAAVSAGSGCGGGAAGASIGEAVYQVLMHYTPT